MQDEGESNSCSMGRLCGHTEGVRVTRVLNSDVHTGVTTVSYWELHQTDKWATRADAQNVS